MRLPSAQPICSTGSCLNRRIALKAIETLASECRWVVIPRSSLNRRIALKAIETVM